MTYKDRRISFPEDIMFGIDNEPRETNEIICFSAQWHRSITQTEKNSQRIIHAHSRISCYNNPFRDKRHGCEIFGSGRKTQFIVGAVIRRTA